MRFILRTRQFKVFLKPPSKLNDDEDKDDLQTKCFCVFCFESAAEMNLLASIASIRKLCRGQIFENEEEILRRGGSTERLGKSPTNKFGRMFFYVVQL